MPRVVVSVSIPPDLYKRFIDLFNGQMKLSRWFVAQMAEVVAAEEQARREEEQQEPNEEA